jgi:branched-chain amino acid transport system permease protein
MSAGARKSSASWGRALLAAVLVGVALFAPPFWVTLGNYIGLYSIVALGLVLLTGVAGQTSFGQAAFVGIGAYTTAILATRFWRIPLAESRRRTRAHVRARPVPGLHHAADARPLFPLATIAWGTSLYISLFGNVEYLGGRYRAHRRARSSACSASTSRTSALFADLGHCARRALGHRQSTRLAARAKRFALRGQLEMCEAGVDAGRLKIVVFLRGAPRVRFGWLYAHLQRFVNPTPFGLPQGIEYPFMNPCGAGSVWGAVVGATLITLAKQLLQDWLPVILGRSGNFEMVVFGVLMVIVLQRAREGVWPWMARWLPQTPPSPVPDAPPLLARDRRAETGVLLDVRKARKQFGGLVAVSDLSFSIHRGEILGLIGPNGAGKARCST